MNCPYCGEEINEHSAHCRLCGADLTLILPLLAHVQHLTRRVEQLEQGSPGAVPSSVPPAAPPLPPPPSHLPSISDELAVILGFLGIAAAHLAVVVLFDTKLEFLLAASIFIPFLVGFLRRSAPRHPILRALIGAIILSAAAVIEMSLVTWSLYQIPLVPQNPYDWREIGNYGGSIAASFIVGALARGLIRFWYIGRGRTKPQRTGVVQQTLKYVGNFEPETLEKLE